MKKMDITNGIGGYPLPYKGEAILADSMEELEQLKKQYNQEEPSLFRYKDGWSNCQLSVDGYLEDPRGGLQLDEFLPLDLVTYNPLRDGKNFPSHPWGDPDDYDPEEDATEREEIIKAEEDMVKILEALPKEDKIYLLNTTDSYTLQVEQIEQHRYSDDGENYYLGVIDNSC